MEDSAIVDLYWARSDDAINETDKKYGRYCAKIAYNILADDEDAKECVNDTYLHAWSAMPTERPRLLASFLAKITRNLSINRYNSAHAEKRGSGELPAALCELEDCVSSHANTEKSFDENETARLINEFLSGVDAKKRVVFVRRYFYADSVADICKRYGLGESAVKSMLQRTREKLRGFLEESGVSV